MIFKENIVDWLFIENDDKNQRHLCKVKLAHITSFPNILLTPFVEKVKKMLG